MLHCPRKSVWWAELDENWWKYHFLCFCLWWPHYESWPKMTKNSFPDSFKLDVFKQIILTMPSYIPNILTTFNFREDSGVFSLPQLWDWSVKIECTISVELVTYNRFKFCNFLGEMNIQRSETVTLVCKISMVLRLFPVSDEIFKLSIELTTIFSIFASLAMSISRPSSNVPKIPPHEDTLIRIRFYF